MMIEPQNPRAMVADETSLRAQAGDWQAQSIRLTGFSKAPIGANDWWKRAVGSEPDVRNSQSKPGMYQDQGQYAGGQLLLSIQGPRFDWILSSPKEPGVLGPLPDLLYKTLPLFLKTLELAPPINRLALGLVLVNQATDLVEANRYLARYLPGLNIDPENTADLIFQINRPTVASLAGADIKVNRIRRWSTSQLSTTQTLLGPENQDVVLGDAKTFCRLELDMSSDHNRHEDLPRELQARLLTYLVDMALLVIVEGEIHH